MSEVALEEAIATWREADRAEADLERRLLRAGWSNVRPRWLHHLRWLAEHPGGTQSQLMREVGQRNLSHDLNRLAELGLVVRQGDDQDRRVKRLELTPSGHALLAAVEGGA